LRFRIEMAGGKRPQQSCNRHPAAPHIAGQRNHRLVKQRLEAVREHLAIGYLGGAMPADAVVGRAVGRFVPGAVVGVSG